MLLIVYTQFPADTMDSGRIEIIDRLLPMLPDSRQQKLTRIRHTQTRVTSLLGLLLLHRGMLRLDQHDFSLHELVYSNEYKPCCPDRFDFNISHSHSLVACALSSNSRIGIDVERIRTMEPERLNQLLSFVDTDIKNLQTDEFFNIWTRKEAVIKADGRGGVWDIGQVQLNGDTAKLYDRIWRLEKIDLARGYAAHIAHDSIDETDVIGPVFLDADQLLSDAAKQKSL